MTTEQQTDQKGSKALADWLERVEASHQWTMRSDLARLHTDLFEIRCYSINGHIVLVQEWLVIGGWQMFIPTDKTNKIADSLDTAAQFCGADGCREIDGVE